MKLSCIALTEPFEAAVVAVAQSAESVSPKRTSLPSMLPPARPRSGLPCASAQSTTARPARNMTPIAAKIATPCRRSPNISP